MNRSVTALLGLALTSTVAAQGQDWPHYLGPKGNSHVVDFKAPVTWPTQLKEVWKVEIGDGLATPALVGDRLYTYSRENPYEIIRCLDAASGKELWQEKHETLAPTGGAASYAGPRSSPAVADGKVVTYGVRGTLSCFDAASGKLLWRKEGTGGAWPTFFISSSPTIINGLCIVQTGNDNEGSIRAFDLASGAEKWSWGGDGTTYASPVAMKLNGTDLVVAQSTKRVVAIDAASGKLAWETPFAVTGREINSVTPIVEGSTIIYGGTGRGFTAVRLAENDGAIAASELWSHKEESMKFSNPMLMQDVLLGLNEGGDLFCVDARTGKLAWKVPTKSEDAAAEPADGRRRRGGGGGGFGTIVGAGGVAIALTPAAEMIVFEPSSAGYQELARIKVANSPTHAYPVLSGNRLFIKDQNSVALLTLP